MELKITGRGADLQNVCALIFYQIPPQYCGAPFSRKSKIFGHSKINLLKGELYYSF
jgi:hypothetical protein